MPLDLNMLIIVTGVALVAYLLFALSGFGSTLIMIPLLAHFHPLTFVLPMLALLDSTAAMRLGFQSRGHLLRHELVWLLPCMAVGMITGVALLVNLPPHLALGTLGGVIAAYGVYPLSGRGCGFAARSFHLFCACLSARNSPMRLTPSASTGIALV